MVKAMGRQNEKRTSKTKAMRDGAMVGSGSGVQGGAAGDGRRGGVLFGQVVGDGGRVVVRGGVVVGRAPGFSSIVCGNPGLRSGCCGGRKVCARTRVSGSPERRAVTSCETSGRDTGRVQVGAVGESMVCGFRHPWGRCPQPPGKVL